MTNARLLADRGIVVTRPAHQAAPLAQMIHAAGGRAILFPVIEIADIGDTRNLDSLIDRLHEFDRAIFVSPNAVYKALTRVIARRTLPPNLKFAAVGRGSVRELAKFGVTEVAAPERFDSEALLELPEMNGLAGQRVVIFRGEGGREVLGDTLIARGARVEYAVCYRRVLPPADSAQLLTAWESRSLDAITVTSSEGLKNLHTLIGARGAQWLKQTPVFAPHARIALTASELGIATVVTTAQGDEGLLAGLQQWFAGRA
jgi:uroporphyrinogen-III synthase